MRGLQAPKGRITMQVEITLGTNDKPTDTKTVRARKTPAPGLVITGSRGQYKITHVQSGRRVCWASVYNTNATIAQVQNAVLMASLVDMVGSVGLIDWTVAADQLPRRLCEDWIRVFGGSLENM